MLCRWGTSLSSYDERQDANRTRATAVREISAAPEVNVGGMRDRSSQQPIGPILEVKNTIDRKLDQKTISGTWKALQNNVSIWSMVWDEIRLPTDNVVLPVLRSVDEQVRQ